MSDSDNFLPEWLRTHTPREPVTSPLAEFANLGAASTPVPASPPPKKPVPRLHDIIERGRKLLERKPFDKFSAVQWLRQVRTVAVDIFGPEAALPKSLDTEIKEAQRSGTSAVQIACKLAEVESFFNRLQSLANSSPSSSRSEVSHPPMTTNVFIIHGKDELNTRRLADVLRSNFNLVPIVMLS